MPVVGEKAIESAATLKSSRDGIVLTRPDLADDPVLILHDLETKEGWGTVPRHQL